MNRKDYTLVLATTVLAGVIGGAVSSRLLTDEPALAQQRSRVVNTEELLLVDKTGKTRAGLGLDANGEIALILTDKTGTKILRLSPDEQMVLRLEEKGGRILWSSP